MKPEYSVSIWEGPMYCKYCSQSHQLQWKDNVDEVVCDNLPARLQRKFQDELYFAADEHLVIDAVCVCAQAAAGCFPDQRKQPINAVAFHLFSSVLAICDANTGKHKPRQLVSVLYSAKHMCLEIRQHIHMPTGCLAVSCSGCACDCHWIC